MLCLWATLSSASKTTVSPMSENRDQMLASLIASFYFISWDIGQEYIKLLMIHHKVPLTLSDSTRGCLSSHRCFCTYAKPRFSVLAPASWARGWEILLFAYRRDAQPCARGSPPSVVSACLPDGCWQQIYRKWPLLICICIDGLGEQERKLADYVVMGGT